jgi:hypothetical protein
MVAELADMMMSFEDRSRSELKRIANSIWGEEGSMDGRTAAETGSRFWNWSE